MPSSSSRKALITGITGQDGSYLAEMLLARGYEVHGVTRDASRGLGCSAHLESQLDLHQPSAEDWESLLRKEEPDELYHFAADSFVPNGWQRPLENLQSNTALTISILEAIRNASPRTRMVNACSREVFGRARDGMADEETEMCPGTPYGINKAASRWWVNAYAREYGVFGCNAILFNHESPRRGVQFVTRKITLAVAEIKSGRRERVELGSLDARRDWGFAGDYVEAMWLMLQAVAPNDFVIGTGITHSIREFAELAFAQAGLKWQEHVDSVKAFNRTDDDVCLAADIGKARRELNWEPSVRLPHLVEMMVQADMARLEAGET